LFKVYKECTQGEYINGASADMESAIRGTGTEELSHKTETGEILTTLLHNALC